MDEGILPEPVEIPILMYHNLVAEEDDPSISKNTMWVGQFQHQMELLEENGFTTITVDQLVEFGNRGKALPEKPVLITFDDGYRSAYELAFPILQEMDFHAAMFPIGVSVGKDTYKDTGLAMVPHFSWEEAKEMAESGLVSIQSHTYDMHQWEAFETAGGGQCLRPNILRQPWETLGEYMQALLGGRGAFPPGHCRGHGPRGGGPGLSRRLARPNQRGAAALLRGQVHLHHRGRESPGDARLRAQPVWAQPVLCKAHHHRRRVPKMGGIKNILKKSKKRLDKRP